MLSAFFSILLSTILTVAHAGPMLSLPSLKEDPVDASELLHKTSSYAIAPMNRVNWVYLGYAPRMQDPSRVSVHISRPGFTIRVTMEMTADDVANYPRYLMDRADDISSIFAQNNLRLTQPALMNRFNAQINEVRKHANNTYAYGLYWLKAFFPNNVFELKTTKANGAKVVVHFVYPATMHAAGGMTAPEGTYYTYSFEERKDYHSDGVVQDYIFGGFPAIWFYGSRLGIGIHGPIRFSNKGEMKTGQKQEDFWVMSEPKNFGYNKQEGINANYRWDLVRKQNSGGCIRAESMEIRHLLPSAVSQIQRVPITMSYKWDQIEVDGRMLYVNVDYYTMDPYQMPLSRDQWFQQVAPQMIANQNSMIHFPYLDSASFEFMNSQGSADLPSMTLLNQAPRR